MALVTIWQGTRNFTSIHRTQRAHEQRAHEQRAHEQRAHEQRARPASFKWGKGGGGYSPQGRNLIYDRRDILLGHFVPFKRDLVGGVIKGPPNSAIKRIYALMLTKKVNYYNRWPGNCNLNSLKIWMNLKLYCICHCYS